MLPALFVHSLIVYPGSFFPPTGIQFQNRVIYSDPFDNPHLQANRCCLSGARTVIVLN